MAHFTRLTAAEADTELREMRTLLLKKLAGLDKEQRETPITTRRIQALNRALESLAAEKPVQGVLIEHPATAKQQERKPTRSAYGG